MPDFSTLSQLNFLNTPPGRKGGGGLILYKKSDILLLDEDMISNEVSIEPLTLHIGYSPGASYICGRHTLQGFVAKSCC